MDEKRRNEIAWILVRHRVRNTQSISELNIGEGLETILAITAKDTGIPFKELLEFEELLEQEIESAKEEKTKHVKKK